MASTHPDYNIRKCLRLGVSLRGAEPPTCPGPFPAPADDDAARTPTATSSPDEDTTSPDEDTTCSSSSSDDEGERDWLATLSSATTARPPPTPAIPRLHIRAFPLPPPHPPHILFRTPLFASPAAVPDAPRGRQRWRPRGPAGGWTLRFTIARLARSPSPPPSPPPTPRLASTTWDAPAAATHDTPRLRPRARRGWMAKPPHRRVLQLRSGYRGAEVPLRDARAVRVAQRRALRRVWEPVRREECADDSAREADAGWVIEPKVRVVRETGEQREEREERERWERAERGWAAEREKKRAWWREKERREKEELRVFLEEEDRKARGEGGTAMRRERAEGV
ncbi:hypothetical protein EDC01DRAFT_791569 [Geopyxis carbonaria]|nr:hypothetical protein EDC01DRAFT_791569 [Geopyxis carbonaria]